MTRRNASILGVLALCAVIIGGIVISSGSDDGPAAFLSRDDQSAIYVKWTRTGDDISGSLSATEVAQQQAPSQTGFFSTAPAPGQIVHESAAFAGTVHDGSVRMLIGSGTQTNRINGRLDGDSLELTIPQDRGVLTRRLKPADDGGYSKAVEHIRESERRRKAAVKAALARNQRADKIAIARVATAFQEALNPASQDDPCRYVTSKVKQNVRGFDFGSGRPTCTAAIRESDAELQRPVSKAPLGVAEIAFADLPALAVSLDGGPPGAVVTWRPKPDPDSFTAHGRQTLFIEEGGRWLVYRCCP